jgi:hypothetical protein
MPLTEINPADRPVRTLVTYNSRMIRFMEHVAFALELKGMYLVSTVMNLRMPKNTGVFLHFENQMNVSCEYCNEPSDAIKYRNFLTR